MQGIEAKVLSMHTIKPIDREAIIEAVAETGAFLIVEEHNVIGGLGSAIAEILMNENLYVVCGQIGIKDQYSSVVGDQNYLRKYYGLDSQAIVNKANSLIRLKKPF
jgi:transketolase